MKKVLPNSLCLLPGLMDRLANIQDTSRLALKGLGRSQRVRLNKDLRKKEDRLCTGLHESCLRRSISEGSERMRKFIS